MRYRLDPLAPNGLSPEPEQQVKQSNGYVAKVQRLNELQDVTISGTPSDNQALAYDTASGKWIPQTISGSGSTAWGDITGTIADQTDLQAELDDKVSTASNVGTPPEPINSASVFKQKTGTDLEFHKISGDDTTGIRVTQDGDSDTVIIGIEASQLAPNISHNDITDIGTNSHDDIDSHIANTSNPHSVTKSQVGLGNVDNTSDANKPISTATQTALDGKAATALSNLASVAINTSLVFDTDSAYNFGSTGAYAANTYTDRLYVNSTAYIDGVTAGKAELNGKLGIVGANGTLTISSDTDGGQFNIGSSTSGTLAIYGSAGATLNVDILDGSLSVASNITVGGTVDGRDVATDGTKLDGIESGATVGGGGSAVTIDLLDAGANQLLGTGQTPHYVAYFHSGKTTTVDRMSAQCTTLAGSGTVYLGIYNSSYSRLATGSVTVSATGIFNVTLDSTLTLTAGTLYYFALLNANANDNGFAAELTDIQTGTFVTFQGATSASSLPSTEATQNTSNRGIWMAAWKS